VTLINAETPVALGAKRSPTQVKGGIARATGLLNTWITTHPFSGVMNLTENEPLRDLFLYAIILMRLV